jgi:hypothetical protein
MPVQLTLRSPKGGRVLHERTYDDGYRVDAASGWLVVIDRNGSVVAAHAACPGLEGRIVEYASAAASPRGDEGNGGPEAPPLRVADVRLPGHPIDDALIDALHTLGRTYGPLGVALGAATLTDPDVLVQRLTEPAGEPHPEPTEGDGAEDGLRLLVGLPHGDEPDDDDPLDHTHDGCEEQADALRAEVARLSGLLDDASREAERAEQAEAELARRRSEWETRSAEGRQQVDRLAAENDRLRQASHAEHAARLRAERLLIAQQETTDTLRGHLDAERARAERAEGLVDDPADLRPVADDPRRPHPGEWPDDAVLLRYVELRRLVSLHLERYADGNVARAMLEGDVPLRLAEVLDR